MAVQFPNQVAVRDEQRSRTWSELLERANRQANVLRNDWALQPGDHIASVLDNRVEWFELSLATLFAGIWLVPVNTHLQHDEVAYILGDSGAKVVLCDRVHRDVVATAQSANGHRPPLRVVEIGEEFDAIVADADDTPRSRTDAPGGRMHYTSGTTGHPKGVKRNLPVSVDAYVTLLCNLGLGVGLDGSGPHLLTGPHYHAAVGGYALFDLVNGAPVTMMDRFDAGRVLDLIERHQIAHTHLVPTMMVRMMRLPVERRDSFDAGSLTHVLHGAAPITHQTKTAMIDWWGPVFTEYWGTSEAGTFTTIDSADSLSHPGSVGRPLPGVELHVLDEAGQDVPTGTVGALYCRTGPSERPFRYYGDETKTDAAYIAPGLFTMGDMGRVDADGFVYLADRSTNMIISGGVNIYPAEVEAALATHPAVVDVVVFGVPDDEWGEQVKAVVERSADSDLGFVDLPDEELAAALITWARDRLAHYKAPKSVDFINEMPRLPSGKLAVRTLKDPHWAGRDRNI